LDLAGEEGAPEGMLLTLSEDGDAELQETIDTATRGVRDIIVLALEEEEGSCARSSFASTTEGDGTAEPDPDTRGPPPASTDSKGFSYYH